MPTPVNQTVTLDQAIELALAHHRAGRLAEAEAIYRQVLAAAPQHVGALNLLGVLAHQIGQRPLARQLIGQALALQPGFAEAHNNLGAVLQADGNLIQAEAEYRQAFALNPAYAEAALNLGIVLWQTGRPGEAEAQCRAALALRPDYAEAHNNLGNALYDQGRPDAAAESYRVALALSPGYAAAHNNLANVLCDLGDPAAAVTHYEQALAAEPGFADYRMNLGNALRDLGQLDAALPHYDRALALRPELHDARWNRALTHLLRGDLARGWADYPARWHTRALAGHRRDFGVPDWDGGDPDGLTILVHAEQGMGDVIQFCRYLPLLQARGARTVLLIDREWQCLDALLLGLDGVDHVAIEADEIGPVDRQCALLDLPRLFGTTLASVPGAVPYLAPDMGRRAWPIRLGDDERPRVGVVWAGNPGFARDRLRSPGLAPLLPLLALPGLRWFVLQVGEGRRDLGRYSLPEGVTDLGPDLADFADTAAAMAELDLVISSCTAAAHLAGALARPTWVLLPAAPDWRWMRDRADSPWYPTMRLFRQRAPGDWSTVVTEIGAGLMALAHGNRRVLEPPSPTPPPAV